MFKKTYNADIKHQDTGCITIQKCGLNFGWKAVTPETCFFLVLSGDQIWSKVAMEKHYLLNL